MSNIKSILACLFAVLAIGIVVYSVAYWAARGWCDGKDKKHG